MVKLTCGKPAQPLFFLDDPHIANLDTRHMQIDLQGSWHLGARRPALAWSSSRIIRVEMNPGNLIAPCRRAAERDIIGGRHCCSGAAGY